MAGFFYCVVQNGIGLRGSGTLYTAGNAFDTTHNLTQVNKPLSFLNTIAALAKAVEDFEFKIRIQKSPHWAGFVQLGTFMRCILRRRCLLLCRSPSRQA
jgi:hypothetical protein